LKPGINPKLVTWLLAAVGGVLVQMSKLDHVSMQGVVDALVAVPDWHVGLAALGGAVVGMLKLGPGQIRVNDLPEEVRASLVPPAKDEPAAGRDTADH
jgi:hypothetical protein